MEEMEKDKVVKQLDVEDVEISKARWEKDREVLDSAVEKKKTGQEGPSTMEDGENVAVGGAEGPVAHAGEEGVPIDQGNGLTEIESNTLPLRDVEPGD